MVLCIKYRKKMLLPSATIARLKEICAEIGKRYGSSLFCVGGLESWDLTRNSKDTTAMKGSISIAHHAILIAKLCLRD
jgi:hypothetical protein